jgi:isovaleryl-CoA dehydrogenase
MFSQSCPFSVHVINLSSLRFAQDLWPKLGDAGFLGPTAPTDFGGLGLGYLEHIILIEELSRVSGSVGLSYVGRA